MVVEAGVRRYKHGFFDTTQNNTSTSLGTKAHTELPLCEHVRRQRKQEQVLQENDVVSMAIQLMSALDHVHANKIVHRDLKPPNLLVSQGAKRTEREAYAAFHEP